MTPDRAAESRPWGRLFGSFFRGFPACAPGPMSILGGLVVLLAFGAPLAAAVEHAVTKDGVAVELSLESLTGAPQLFEDDFVRVRFEIAETGSGTPLPRLFPAGWMDRLASDDFSSDDQCRTKVASFIGGSFLAKTELDLNVYYVLALNENASISVVDPLFGFGGSKLLTTVKLPAPGQDWVLGQDGERLFVTMPATRHVAVVETRSWQLATRAEVPGSPGRLLLQPDGAIAWTSWQADGEAARGGVAAVSTVQLKSRGEVVTGLAPHDLAVSEDNRFLFVANGGSGTVSMVDTASLEVAATFEVGPRPVAIAYSPLAKVLVVADAADGSLTVIGEEEKKILARLEGEPGLAAVSFSPDGRYAFAVNPESDELVIVDAVSQSIVQRGDMEKGPIEVAFSDELAYVMHRDSEDMLMIPLATVGRPGEPISVVDFPAGTYPPARFERPSRAPRMVQAPGAPAMLVANAPDKAIYYYKEGMAAPMGHFRNYGRVPRAVMVVDRSLQESAPGVYETTVRLRRPGRYDLAFFLDSPRIVHCFPIEVAANPARAAERERRAGILRPAKRISTQTVGDEVELLFRVRHPLTGEAMNEVADLAVLTLLAPGRRHQRQRAEAVGEDGLYRVAFTPQDEGVYYVFAESRSLGVTFNENPFLTFRVLPAGQESESGGER